MLGGERNCCDDAEVGDGIEAELPEVFRDLRDFARAGSDGHGFSADEGADVGEDLATPVSVEYQVPASFTGTIQMVTIEVQPIAVADRPAVEASASLGLERPAEID
jgi:hypothetical protein